MCPNGVAVGAFQRSGSLAGRPPDTVVAPGGLGAFRPTAGWPRADVARSLREVVHYSAWRCSRACGTWAVAIALRSGSVGGGSRRQSTRGCLGAVGAPARGTLLSGGLAGPHGLRWRGIGACPQSARGPRHAPQQFAARSLAGHSMSRLGRAARPAMALVGAGRVSGPAPGRPRAENEGALRRHLAAHLRVRRCAAASGIPCRWPRRARGSAWEAQGGQLLEDSGPKTEARVAWNFAPKWAF